MKRVVRKIDRAIKQIYNLEHEFQAEDFLVLDDYADERVASGKAVELGLDGALLIRHQKRNEPDEEITLGIYLSESVRLQLSTFPHWEKCPWSNTQLKAFTVATEEVSHFHYLLHHALGGRSLSQIELELQGEIDKFILVFFAQLQQGKAARAAFETLYEQFFVNYRLSDKLTDAERRRYHEASQLAMRFIYRCRRYLDSPRHYDRAFRLLRQFYRLNRAEKLSFIAALS
jgi:hypothetical protein